MSINFFKGHPTPSLLPAQEISEAYRSVLLEANYVEDEYNRLPLNYGTDPGNFDIRQTISEWINHSFKRDLTTPEEINLTAGASYGVANILTTTVDPKVTKRGFIVSPTYFLINNTFLDFGFGGKLTAINETVDSEYDIDLNYLEHELKRYSKGLESSDGKEINVVADPNGKPKKLYRFVIYLVPTFSNPGGATYSVKTRLKLLELARRYDLLIISDDVYDLLDYRETEVPVPRINFLDKDTLPPYNSYGNSISNGSFSKLIAPGLRVGWQETPSAKLTLQLASTGANKSGGSPAQLSTFVVQHLIKNKAIYSIIENLKSEYSKRAKTAIEAINKYLPQSTKIYGGDGGYFLWVRIPNITDHDRVVINLQSGHNVILASGQHFEVHGDSQGWGKDSVRLAISYLSSQEIEKGIKEWGKVLQQLHPELY